MARFRQQTAPHAHLQTVYVALPLLAASSLSFINISMVWASAIGKWQRS